MQFTITGKHIDITPAIRARAEERVSKLPRYYSNINIVEVIVEHNQGQMPVVEIIARGEHSKTFIAKESDADLYAAIDMAVHKLERQLTKTKTKERDNKNSGPSAAGPVEQ